MPASLKPTAFVVWTWRRSGRWQDGNFVKRATNSRWWPPDAPQALGEQRWLLLKAPGTGLPKAGGLEVAGGKFWLVLCRKPHAVLRHRLSCVSGVQGSCVSPPPDPPAPVLVSFFLIVMLSCKLYIIKFPHLQWTHQDFPGGAVVKNPPANAGDMGLSPGPGRSHMPRGN